MMRILADTDVVLDLLLDRAPFVEAAARLWELQEQGRLEIHISAITPLNVYYIARRLRGAGPARQAVEALLSCCHVCPVTPAVLTEALTLRLSDYEDAVQCVSASASSLSAIVTRNGKDFQGAPMPVYTPQEIPEHLP